jgi:flagellar basal-body rod protein FlgB
VFLVQPVYLFNLAFQHAEWLSVRQTTVAENIANSNTPNYRAREVEPFETTLNQTNLAMRSTDPRHASLAVSSSRPSTFESKVAETAGGGVSLEQQLIKAGEITRDYSLNVSIVKSFHRMWMSSIKG